MGEGHREVVLTRVGSCHDTLNWTIREDDPIARRWPALIAVVTTDISNELD